MKPKGHRNLFNADCNAFFYQFPARSYWHLPDQTRMSMGHIDKCIGVLAENGVDTLLVNPNAQRAWYPSQVVQNNLDGYKRGDRTFFFGHLLGQVMTREQLEKYFTAMTVLMDRYLDLAEDGVNWVKESAPVCRKHKISPWLSIRMNDMHGATVMPEFSIMNCRLFADPALRLRGVSYNSKDPLAIGWQGFNYEKPEVREFMMALIRECVEQYDYEGIELDWSRQPLCCEPGASAMTRDLITSWHGEIRRLARKKARRTGRPFYVGIRYLGTLDQLETIGIDLRAMARKDLIDFVCPTNGWQTSWDIPCDQLKLELGEDVAVYGVLEDAPNWLFASMPDLKKPHPWFPSDVAEHYRLASASAPVLRGNAAAKLALGADGIETFNFFCSEGYRGVWDEVDCHADYPALRNLDRLKFLRGQPKFYTFSSKGGCYSHPWFDTVGEFPVVLEPQNRHEARLPMAAEPASSPLSFTIQVVIEKYDNPPDIGVSFNGSWPNFDAQPNQELLFPVGGLTHHVSRNQAFNYTFPAASIREGWNDIVICNGSHKTGSPADRKDGSIKIVSLEFAVRPNA